MEIQRRSTFHLLWKSLIAVQRRYARRRTARHRWETDVLEARTLLASTYQPIAAGSIRDVGSDGTPDSLDPVFTGLVTRSGDQESRAVAEFSLGSETVGLAVLDFTLGSANAAGNQTRIFDVYVYGGDGVVTLSDYIADGVWVGKVTLEVALLHDTYRLNVTEAVQDLTGGGNSIVGVKVVSHTDTFPVVFSTSTLTTNGVNPMGGLRGWETTRNAILADGVETLRLEVDAGGAVKGVELDTLTADYRLFKPGAGRISLRDDGLEGDRIPGDYIYTSGEFRYNTAYPMGAFYQGQPDSISGIESINLGSVYIVELDNSESQLLLTPEAGLVSPDIAPVSATQLSSGVQITPHLINLNTTKKATQSSMRESRIRTSELANMIYSALPNDDFDFLNFFSTNHLEMSPRLSSVNFRAGIHNSLKVEWTGSATPLQDFSSGYGSDGRLLGVNLLDTMSRGISAGNATHELVHQWSAYLSSALGISESGGHFLNWSSAGSLVGGFEWVPNGDGNYTINFDEGRNGARHASPLELYMMGLIDKSKVPDILVYDHVATPKSSSNPIVLADEITRRITIDDIIAVHGERTGPVRKDFRVGFVAESHGRFLTGAELAFYEQIAAHYTRDIPADEADPLVSDGWSSIDRFFGHGTTWTTLLPGQSETINHAPVAVPGVFSVRSDAIAGAAVGTVVATDEDAGQNLRYAIIAGHVSPNVFAINPSTGQITILHPTRLNDKTQHVLKVRVTDNGTPQQYDTVDVVIDVIANQPPVLPSHTFSINENPQNFATVGTVLATDPDVGQSLSYAITSSSLPGAFLLMQYNGDAHATLLVQDRTLLNYEAVTSITLEITATDNGIPSLSSTGTVTVNLNDVNEAPTIEAQTFSVPENSANGVEVGVIAASDVDAGQTLSYSIFFGNTSGAFAVDSSTGRITVANSAALDFEASTTWSLYVNVFDNGTPQRMDSEFVTIQISDVNEAPSAPSQNFSVPENSANETFIGTVAGTDPDQGQSLSYAITSSSLPGGFQIDAGSGVIRVADSSKLNYESAASATLHVTVTDNGVPVMATTTVVTINLIDVNEAPTMSPQSFSVNENSANGTVVGNVVASDVDAGQTLTFSIVSGNSSGAFAMNSSTGQITVANSGALDFETSPAFSLLVNVADNGSPQLSAASTMTISLLDVVETLNVGLDVVPGDSSNTFRRTSTFELAILSTASFDARNVNLLSIRFGKLGTENSVVRDKKGKVIYSLRDVNGDGRLDLVVQIDASKTGLVVGDTLGRLTGALTNGMSIFGSSSVNVKR